MEPHFNRQPWKSTTQTPYNYVNNANAALENLPEFVRTCRLKS
ncbi:hypothetical protein ACLK1Z_22405 [Escherichia coli]